MAHHSTQHAHSSNEIRQIPLCSAMEKDGERHPNPLHTRGVGGSIPPAPTKLSSAPSAGSKYYARCIALCAGLDVGPGSNTAQHLAGRITRAVGPGTPSRAPHWAMRRGVSADTNEMFADYARSKCRVNVGHRTTGHHVSAIPELGAGDVKARSRVHLEARAARSAAALYVAEHSSKI
jgi:hypothetical protein